MRRRAVGGWKDCLFEQKLLLWISMWSMAHSWCCCWRMQVMALLRLLLLCWCSCWCCFWCGRVLLLLMLRVMLLMLMVLVLVLLLLLMVVLLVLLLLLMVLLLVLVLSNGTSDTCCNALHMLLCPA